MTPAYRITLSHRCGLQADLPFFGTWDVKHGTGQPPDPSALVSLVESACEAAYLHVD